jgi:hypothetical protein
MPLCRLQKDVGRKLGIGVTDHSWIAKDAAVPRPRHARMHSDTHTHVRTHMSASAPGPAHFCASQDCDRCSRRGSCAAQMMAFGFYENNDKHWERRKSNAVEEKEQILQRARKSINEAGADPQVPY